MTLTEEQKMRVIKMLDGLSESRGETIISSEQSFLNWLEIVALDIYNAISNAISQVWNWLKSLYS